MRAPVLPPRLNLVSPQFPPGRASASAQADVRLVSSHPQVSSHLILNSPSPRLSLTYTDLRYALAQHNIIVTDKQFEQLMDTIDADHDGKVCRAVLGRGHVSLLTILDT